jgi:hypothetical protein
LRSTDVRIERGLLVSDEEIVIDAVEEAQRILANYVVASPRRNQDEILNMLLYVLCRTDVAAAVKRLKSGSRLQLVR